MIKTGGRGRKVRRLCKLMMDETIAQRDVAMGLAAEASASAAEATTRALGAVARAKEAEASAAYQSRLRIKAEEMVERQARRIAASEAEPAELRRKLSEMQSNSAYHGLTEKSYLDSSHLGDG